MKRILFFALLSCFLIKGKGQATSASSSFPDFVYTGTMTVTTLSASAWTYIPYSTYNYNTSGDRSAVWLDLDPAAPTTQNVRIAITTSNVAPGTTFYGYQVQAAYPPWIVSFDKRLFLWGIAEGTAVGLISQEFK